MFIFIENEDVSKKIGQITITENIEELANKTDFTSFEKFTIGNKIRIVDKNVDVFVGIITDKQENSNEISYTAFDFAFYLNKSKTIKQFNDINSKNAIASVLSEFNVQIGEIPNLNVNIKKIYLENTANEIIDDILKQNSDETNKIYLKEVQENKLRIYEKGTKKIKEDIEIEINKNKINVLKSISKNYTFSESMQDMKNKIVVVVGGEESVKKLANIKDDASISKYGLLTEIKNIDEKDTAKAQNIAEQSLKNLNKIATSYQIETIGSFELRRGRTINISLENIKGEFIIQSLTHNITKDIHTTNLNIEKMGE